MMASSAYSAVNTDSTYFYDRSSYAPSHLSTFYNSSAYGGSFESESEGEWEEQGLGKKKQKKGVTSALSVAWITFIIIAIILGIVALAFACLGGFNFSQIKDSFSKFLDMIKRTFGDGVANMVEGIADGTKELVAGEFHNVFVDAIVEAQSKDEETEKIMFKDFDEKFDEDGYKRVDSIGELHNLPILRFDKSKGDFANSKCMVKSFWLNDVDVSKTCQAIKYKEGCKKEAKCMWSVDTDITIKWKLDNAQEVTKHNKKIAEQSKIDAEKNIVIVEMNEDKKVTNVGLERESLNPVLNQEAKNKLSEIGFLEELSKLINEFEIFENPTEEEKIKEKEKELQDLETDLYDFLSERLGVDPALYIQQIKLRYSETGTTTTTTTTITIYRSYATDEVEKALKDMDANEIDKLLARPKDKLKDPRDTFGLAIYSSDPSTENNLVAVALYRRPIVDIKQAERLVELIESLVKNCMNNEEDKIKEDLLKLYGLMEGPMYAKLIDIIENNESINSMLNQMMRMIPSKGSLRNRIRGAARVGFNANLKTTGVRRRSRHGRRNRENVMSDEEQGKVSNKQTKFIKDTLIAALEDSKPMVKGAVENAINTGNPALLKQLVTDDSPMNNIFKNLTKNAAKKGFLEFVDHLKK